MNFDFKFVPTLLLSFIVCLLVASRASAADVHESNKYHHLAELLRPSAPASDFVALTEFNQDYEKSVHNASIEYLNAHPELVQRIRDDLGGQEIRWHLERLSHRLIFAPERREEVAGLFTEYCQEAIDDLLDLTGLVNPYSSISTLVDETPGTTPDPGIRAFIVQDLAREYQARYQFSGPSAKRIEIGLSGRIALNEVGSYSSYLQYSQETHVWQFTHNRQTVWKSVSANPYTVLMTPLEETLHIALREYTEKAIRETVAGKAQHPSLEEVQQVVEEWLSVEEAIVGGLVYKLIPDVVIKRIPDLPREWIQADLQTKAGFKKYRLLPKAIDLVQNHGIKESIHLYAQDPGAIRTMLTTDS